MTLVSVLCQTWKINLGCEQVANFYFDFWLQYYSVFLAYAAYICSINNVLFVKKLIEHCVTYLLSCGGIKNQELAMDDLGELIL